MLLFMAGLLFWSSLASLLPTLSLYIKEGGATDLQLGIVMGAFAIGLLLFRPWLGNLADRRDRKFVLLIGLLVAMLAPLGYLFSQSVLFLISVRIFHGISIAAFATGFSALVADISPVQKRGEIIGYMTLVNPIGMAIGPALGGYLQAWVGHLPLFWIAAGIGLAGLIFAERLTPPGISKEAQQIQTTNVSFWTLMLSPRLRIPVLVMALIGMAFGTLAMFVPLFIEETGVNLNAGLFYTAAAIASFMMRLVIGRASDRFGRGRFITLGLVLYVAAMTLLWQAHTPIAFLLAGFFEGAGAGTFLPMMIVLMADRSQPHERGRIFSVSLSGFDLGIAIAGPCFGYFANQLGYRNMFGVVAGLALLAMVIFITQCSKNLFHSLRFSLSDGEDLYAISQ